MACKTNLAPFLFFVHCDDDWLPVGVHCDRVHVGLRFTDIRGLVIRLEQSLVPCDLLCDVRHIGEDKCIMASRIVTIHHKAPFTYIRALEPECMLAELRLPGLGLADDAQELESQLLFVKLSQELGTKINVLLFPRAV